MPVARFEMPDGRIARFEVPEGTTPEQAQSLISKSLNAQPEQTQAQQRNWSDVPGEAMRNLPSSAGNFASGIYQTVRHPINTAESLIKLGAGAVRNTIPEGYRSQRPEAVQASDTANAVGNFYKDRYGSMEGFKGAIATDPIGVASDMSALLSGGAMVAPKAAKNVLNAAAKYTNPMTAIAGTVKGGAKAGKATARSLMQSAVKPTIEQLRKGEAQTAIQTLLDYGISPTEKGVGQIRAKVDDLNQAIANRLAGSRASVARNDVLGYLGDVRGKFGTQVNPTDDLNAIQRVGDEFSTQWPGNIPVQLAQKLKQGTYKALKGKYGEVGSASTEAQKALARGLKDQIAKVVPGIGKLNAEEARLLDTLKVTERRALMELNKNPVGLSALAGNPAGFAAFMADRSAAFKAIVARMINRASDAPGLLNAPADYMRRAGVEPLATSNAMSQAGLLEQR